MLGGADIRRLARKPDLGMAGYRVLREALYEVRHLVGTGVILVMQTRLVWSPGENSISLLVTYTKGCWTTFLGYLFARQLIGVQYKSTDGLAPKTMYEEPKVTIRPCCDCLDPESNPESYQLLLTFQSFLYMEIH